jgi:transposase-like protein
MKRNKSPFKWRHFEPTIILLCVRGYCRYSLSYRDLEEMMRERGLSIILPSGDGPALYA